MPSSSEKWNQFYNEGLEHSKNNKYQEAFEAFVEAEKLHPDGKFPEASMRSGHALFHLKKYEEALAKLSKAENDRKDRKYPYASYLKGFAYLRLKNEELAMMAFLKAEADGDIERIPDASYQLGRLLVRSKMYDEAKKAYSRAEQFGSNGYPVASYFKGTLYHILGEFREAVASYEKAERDSDKQQYPDASNCRGIAWQQAEQLKEALVAYMKAFHDANEKGIALSSQSELLCPESIHAEIWHLQGKALIELGRYEEALPLLKKALEKSQGELRGLRFDLSICLRISGKLDEAIELCKQELQDCDEDDFYLAYFYWARALEEKGEIDEAISMYQKSEEHAPGQKFPPASHNKAFLFEEQKKHTNAISSLKKAIEDSPGQIRPESTYLMAHIMYGLKRYDEAIAYAQEAEDSSLDNIYPKATHLKGDALIKLEQYQLALKEFEKVERDSGNRSPSASSNRGLCLDKVSRFDEAIEAFEKARIDSLPKKFAAASYNKGITYTNMELVDAAIKAFHSAIEDAAGNIYPLAHLRLANLYLGKNSELAATHAFKAILQDNRNWETVNLIEENIAAPNLRIYYTNRLEFLYTQIDAWVKQSTPTAPQIPQFWSYSPAREEGLNLFCTLLQLPDLEMPFPSTFEERHRLAYLIYFHNNQPWHTYQVISKMKDLGMALTSLDNFFYLKSALLIAASVDDLKQIINGIVIPENHSLSAKLQFLVNAVKSAYENNLFADGYLLNIDPSQYQLNVDDITSIRSITEIEKVLFALVTDNTEYKSPLSPNILNGLLSRVFYQIHEGPGFAAFRDKTEWKNFENSVRLADTANLDFDLIIGNIRNAIKNEVPYLLILSSLFELYSKTEDDQLRKNIAVLQAVAVVSNYFDYNRRPFYRNVHSQMVAGCAVDLLAHESISMFVTYGLIANFGIAVVVGYLTGLSFKVAYERWDEAKVEEVFERIKQDLV